MKKSIEEAAKISAKSYDGIDYNIAFNGHDIEESFYDGFIEGAKWQAKKSPWISVEDRLPDTDSGQSLYEVLVQTRDHRYKVEVNVYVERMAEKGEIMHCMSIPE